MFVQIQKISFMSQAIPEIFNFQQSGNLIGRVNLANNLLTRIFPDTK